jgi:virginiamycin B lyase
MIPPWDQTERCGSRSKWQINWAGLIPQQELSRNIPWSKGKTRGPHGLVADKEGNIWFTANFGGYIGKLDPRTGKVTQYKMPDESVDDPHTAAFDAHGILWFTAQGGNAVGRLDPRTGKIELNKVPTESALPYGDSD